MSLKSLNRLPAFDKKTKLLHAVIETPKRSPNKYAYDPDLGCITLGKTLPEGMSFPFDFGFIPSTLGDDGDPLDILVLMDFPAVAGCLVKARLLGSAASASSICERARASLPRPSRFRLFMMRVRRR